MLLSLFMVASIKQGYDYSTTRRPIPMYCFSTSEFEKYGLVKPENDPGLVPGSHSREDVQKLDREAKNDTNGFNDNCHLPKGLFQPTGEIDPSKPTMLINVSEMQGEHSMEEPLTKILKAIDDYFRLDWGEAKQLKNKANIIVTWSTSAEDALKTLKMAKDKIGNLANTFSLFINANKLNQGTGPNFSHFGGDEDKGGGKSIPKMAAELLDFNSDKMKTLIQRMFPYPMHYPKHVNFLTSQWGASDNTRTLVSQLSKDFAAGDFHEVTKLEDGLNRWHPRKPSAVQVPIEAFAEHFGLAV